MLFLLRFWRKYHVSHVMMKIGRMSAPGTSSNKDISPIHRNMARQAMSPTMSRMSPTTGRSRTATIYSLTSSIMQITRKSNSSPVKTKYREKDFDSFSRRSKHYSSCLQLGTFLSILEPHL